MLLAGVAKPVAIWPWYGVGSSLSEGGPHSKGSRQFSPMFLNRIRDHRGLRGRRQAPQTDQQNAGRGLLLPKDELAEILVSRDQHALRVLTLTQNDFIHDPRRHLGQVGNLVAIESKAFENLAVDAFISQE